MVSGARSGASRAINTLAPGTHYLGVSSVSNATKSAAIHQAAAGRAAFCARVLPAVERHARFAFRHLTCAESREDAVQEAIGLSWMWFRRLARRGKDATAFPTALAGFAARAVRS